MYRYYRPDCLTTSVHNSSRSACGRDRWLWRERLWENERFKTRMDNATRKINKRSRIRVWQWRRAKWWWRIELIRNTKSRRKPVPQVRGGILEASRRTHGATLSDFQSCFAAGNRTKFPTLLVITVCRCHVSVSNLCEHNFSFLTTP